MESSELLKSVTETIPSFKLLFIIVRVSDLCFCLSL